MAILPFVVQPKNCTETVRIGNDDIGVIEITRKGYLSVAEKAFVDSVMQGSDGVTQLVFLSNKIAKEHKTTTEKAYMAITDVMQGNATSKLHEIVQTQYADEVSQITAKMAESVQRRAIAITTILLQTRVNHEWGIEDTMSLDPLFLEKFVELYEQEERREPVNPETKEKEAAEIVGK